MKTGTMCVTAVSHAIRRPHVSVVCLALFIVYSALNARAGNIFDDDWTPPKRAAQPPTAPTQLPPAVPIPAATAPSQLAPASQTPSRRAIPGKLDLARSRGLLKEAFAKQLKDRSSAGRRKLAQALLDEVPKAADNPTDQYVLLGGAIEASKDAAVLRLCFQAADAMASQYEIDALNIKTEAGLKMNLRGDSPATAAENVTAALELIDPLLEAEEFSTAARILALARAAATSDPSLASIVQKRIQVVETLRTAHDRFAQQFQKLKTSPDDPTANLAVGSYLCFNKGEWEKGLPMLAKGSDANLKQLAALELSRPTTAEDVIRVGDGWWDLGEKTTGATKGQFQNRACKWYGDTAPTLTGLMKVRVETRMKSLDSIEPPRVVNLLKLVDVSTDSVNGKWELRDGTLVSDATTCARIEILYRPPAEYDYKVVFTRMSGNDCVNFLCWASGHQFYLNIGTFNNTFFGFGLINGSKEDNNKTGRHSAAWLVNGKRYTSVVKVRKDGVQAYLDGKLVTEWKTDYQDMSVKEEWSVHRGDTIGLATFASPTIFHSVEVIEIVGNGQRLR